MDPDPDPEAGPDADPDPFDPTAMLEEALRKRLAVPPSPAALLAALRRTQHMLVLYLDRCVDGLGLSYAQVEVMELLDARPTIHGGEIARRLRITRQAAHRLLRQLELGDLADRRPFDGYVRPAVLTDTGRARLTLARSALEATHRMLEQLVDEERLALGRGLGALEKTLVPRVERWW